MALPRRACAARGKHRAVDRDLTARILDTEECDG